MTHRWVGYPRTVTFLAVLIVVTLGIPSSVSLAAAPPPVATAQDLEWVPYPAPTTEILNGVKMLSATDGWAVGANGTTLHWNGSEWVVVPGPVTTVLRTVDFVSPNDGWAAGYDGHGAVLLHWESNQWTVFQSPEVTDIDMVSSDDGWALAAGGLLHWDGHTWSQATLPSINGIYLTSLSMVSADNGWVIGAEGYDNLLLHWDGKSWQKWPFPTLPHALIGFPPPNPYTSIDMVSANDGWIVASGMPVLRWNGLNWAYVGRICNGASGKVSMRSSADGWTLGYNGLDNSTYFCHWDGQAWTLQTTVPYAITDLSMVSPTDGWAVGWLPGHESDSGVILHYTALASKVQLNYSTGQPGSFFRAAGSGFFPATTAQITVNGHVLTDTVQIDQGGGLTFLLDTAGSSPGEYWVTLQAGQHQATAHFQLAPDQPLRPPAGEGMTLSVPGGIAFTQFMNLPILWK